MKKILKVVQTSSNPISGSPYELNLLLQKSTLISSRMINGTNEYKEKDNVPARKFPKDLLWNEDREECIKVIQEADIIHCHNTIFPPNLKDYTNPNQKIVLQIYSVDREALKEHIDKGLKIADIIVIADQPWQKEIYKDLSTTHLPLVKNDHIKSKKFKNKPIVVYAPTNKYGLDHIYSKGYNEVISVLNKLKGQFDFEFKLIEGVDYVDNLQMKRNSTILIDDIINPAFHGSSIEAAAYGAIPITNHSDEAYPFFKTDLSSLESNLSSLLSSPELLKTKQKEINTWFKDVYYPSLLKRYEQFYFYNCLLQNIKDANNDTKDMLYAKYEILTIMHQWLSKHRIFHFLSFGTALKAYRDRDFATDNDFGVWYKDRWKIYNLLQSDPPEELLCNCIWRGEFTFRLKSRPYPKIDLLFFEEKDNGYHCNLYLRNTFNNVTSMEKGLLISKEALFEFKSFQFCNQKFIIPKNIELYLDENYGPSWREPKKQALGWGGRPCHYPEHREYAICMVTFMRDNKMKECVESIRKFYPDEWVRIYIADQNEFITEETQKYYNELTSKGHVIVKVPHNSGLSYGRNTLVNQVKEPYLMIIDDDFKFTNKTDLTKLKNVLEEDDSIGICGAHLLGQDPYLAWMYYNPILKKIFKIKTDYVPRTIYITKNYPYRPDGTKYEYTDIVLNCFLAKTEMFQNIQWDENLLLAEHTDFFMRLKETKWNVVYASEIECEHNHLNNSKEYQDLRSNVNRDIGVQRFCEKWELNDLNDIFNIPPTRQKPIVTIPKPEIIQEKIEPVTIKNVFDEIVEILNNEHLPFALIKDTCKDVVIYNDLLSNKIYIGCIINDVVTEKFLKLHYVKKDKSFSKDSITVIFSEFPKHTKSWTLKNQQYKVPYPLINYLSTMYGEPVRILLKEKGYV